ncbi:glycosyltransferase WbuB [Brevibacillus fluminis]|uniref:Glycosyltransferase WbuB n=1 Tax=Brevibacillus fluminis TaxID=511487 RepID=A0A3M8DJ26_9BACL|nr:glycosyltransferase family 4 protein [Brevibacillus fluminis]RNB87375.1 glycosyltransferase WbuB [Brevibacillus fluminis]
MNIMFINPYAGSMRYGMQLRPYYLAKKWVKIGHQVTIVAATYAHVRTHQPNPSGGIAEEEEDGIRYVWLPTMEYEGNGLKRVINMMQFSWALLRLRKQLAERYQPDVVVASSPHPFSIFGAEKIARQTGAKLVFEVRDLWPLTLIELGHKSPWHPFIMLMQYAENYAYRKADKVVSLLPKADRYMILHGMEPHKFTYLPNGIDVDEWQQVLEGGVPELHRETIARYKAEGRFLLAYTGSHGLADSLHHLVAAADELRDQPVGFLCVGHGPEKPALEQLAVERGLDNVAFLPPVSKAALLELLTQMDVLYIGWKREEMYRFGVSPNKLFDYMMAAKPVIHAIEAGNDPVAASGCGITIPPEDPQAIAQAISTLRAMSGKERAEMGMRGREYVLAEHNLEQLAARFLADM